MKTNLLQLTKTSSLLILFIILSFRAQAQEVVQESLDWRKLRVRLSGSMTAPLAIENDLKLPMNINLDGYFDLSPLLDLRGGLSLGTFRGFTLGGTFHFRDKVVNKKAKFIVSSTNYFTEFYKGYADIQKTWGPTINIQMGSYSETGFYGRFDAGIDLQRRSRAYYNGYGSGKNGYSSVRIMATMVKLNQFEHAQIDGLHSRTGMGAVINWTSDLRPWKRVGFYAEFEFGYLKLLGVEDYEMQYVTIENTKSWILLGMKLGVSVGIF